MKFQYSEKKVKLPGNVHAYAEKKVMKLERFFGDDADALVTFSVEKNRNNVEITVDEAGYDGKTLYLQWRYRMLDVDRTLGDPDESGLYSDDLQLLDDHNVGWWIDHIWINGKAIDMPANSAEDERGSSVPGEIIKSCSYRLDNEDLYLPDGQIDIALPIGERQPLEAYSLIEHPEMYDEDGTLKLPEKGMVAFRLSTDMRSKVKVEKPEQWTEMPDVRACVSKVTYTPIMMYVNLTMEGNPESLLCALPGARLIRVVFNGADATGKPLIARMATEIGIEANIAYASTRSIEGRVYGSMLLSIENKGDDVTRAIAYLTQDGDVTAQEVTQYAE